MIRTMAVLALTVLPNLAVAPPNVPRVPDVPAPVNEPMRPGSPQDEFWQALQRMCDGAFEGTLLAAPEGDTQVDPRARLVVHFWECGPEELRIPFHIGENRSRTWVLLRHAEGIELRHDHRREDGTEEGNTWYGAVTLEEGTAWRQEFVTERAGVRAGWRIEIHPDERYVYGTIRDGQWRHHLEFDLTRPVETPPLPWGHDVRPSALR
jgi:hypothetical protein